MIKKILFLFFVVFAATAYSQDVTITGTVTDANSEPLVGVNVLVKGTTTGAITDIDGNFSVSGKKGSTLVFSYIGMLTQEVVYKGTALRVVMKDDSKALEEVVVIGYQTVKKSDLTGAVAVVDTKEMKKSAAGTLVSQMQGLATGINVRSSGRAGEDASIEIRGVGSLSNNSPLWVIDGMITDPGVDFNPADAESIQILKDASAAAIYGSRAANGVIIVTTKKGTKGPMKVNVSVKETLEWSPKFDLMNAAEYIKYNDIAYKMEPVFPEKLNYVNASHVSPYGRIGSSWKRDGNKLEWNVEIPANTTATIKLPLDFHVQVDAGQAGIHSVEEADGKLVVELGSGKYVFMSE